MIDINTILFQFSAILILVFFYAIYLGKMTAQKRKGIQTDQIARGNKPKALAGTELIMKLATYCIIIVEVASIYLNTATPLFSLRIAGAILGITGIILFGTAVYTMRDSWRAGIPERNWWAGIPEKDKTELITTGIFRISRNPAFLAFYLVYIGILLMFFNPVLFFFTAWAIVMLHLQIKQEEKFLLATFGDEYAKYRKQTRRYI